MRATSTALLLLAACGCGARDAAPAVEQGGGPTREAATEAHGAWVPLELHRSLVFAEVRVNGRPVTALVDSRSSHTVVDAALAGELGLESVGESALTGIGGREETTWLEPLQVGLGGWTFPDDGAMALDLSEVAQLAGKPFDVVLGVGLFANFVVDLDLPRARMALSEPAALGELVLPPHAVALRREGPWLQLEARVEDQAPTWFDVDTGSNARLGLYARYTAEHALLEGRSPRSTLWAGGVGGGLVSDVASLEAFHLGDLALRDMPATFLREAPAMVTESGAAGNLGNGLLRRFRCVFDLANARLHLGPAEGWDAPFDRDRGGVMLRLEDGALEVLHVSEGGPAEAAGLAVGDRVVAIDGEPVAADYYDGASRWTHGDAGRRVTLTLADGGERTLVLADYY